jgi:hypothetical protein
MCKDELYHNSTKESHDFQDLGESWCHGVETTASIVVRQVSLSVGI